MAFAKCLVCQHRISLIEVFAITHQYFCIRNLDQFAKVFTGIYVTDSKMTSRLRDRMIFFPVIERICLCAAESRHIHKPIWSSAKEASVSTINQS